ncbi:MAG: flagellar filament capping protein FliD [Rhodocyclaceae bacterium]
MASTLTGTITSTGLASGLPIDSLVSKLMAVEQQPITTLQTKEASYKTQLSALGTLKGALSSLQTAAQAINTASKLAAFTAKVADTTVASASASGSAAAGTYSLEVTQLAQAQKIKTGSYASLTSAVGSGTLSIQTGSVGENGFEATKTVNITLSSPKNTVQDLRDAINSSGAGVTATLVNDGGDTPYRLVLTAKDTGTANAFKLSGVNGMDYDPSNVAGSSLTQIQGSKDAKFKLDGIDFVKSSNTVTDAVDGLTLNLSKTNEGSATTLTLARDASAMSDKISAFVQAYNQAIQVMRSQTSYNADTKTAGTLNGDSTVRSITQQLRSAMSSTVTVNGSAAYLSDIGITTAVDGTLSIDSTKLTAALTDSKKDVASMFGKVGDNNGFAARIDNLITSMTADDGMLTARTNGINSTIKTLDARIESMTNRLTSIEARYRAQFNALDSTLSSLNSTSTYLTQQLATLQTNYTGQSS